MENATIFTVTSKLLLLVETVSFWGLFGTHTKKKKKTHTHTHINKMTWQLTVETNRMGDLLTEPNVGM